MSFPDRLADFQCLSPDRQVRLWQDAGLERFSSFTELNVWLLDRCRRLWQELRHPEYADLSVADMLEHEQPSLMPMVAPFDGYTETLPALTPVAPDEIRRYQAAQIRRELRK